MHFFCQVEGTLYVKWLRSNPRIQPLFCLQIHCIEDFHRRWAPKCSVCLLPIMPQKEQEETVRVVALDRSFHVECYR